jgi:hypothetical protein
MIELDKVATGGNVSDIGMKPTDQPTMEKHRVSTRLGRKAEQEIAHVGRGSRKSTHAGNDVARIAGILKHCGSCMVGLVTMVSRTEAATDKEPDDDNDVGVEALGHDDDVDGSGWNWFFLVWRLLGA